MKHCFLLFLFSILLSGNGSAQKNTIDYFQQNVNYDIEVQLDDKEHSLRGNIKIEYTNNAPDELNKIAFHLWPNAFKNKSTAYFEQQIHLGNVSIHQIPESSLGYIDSLNFMANGEILRIDQDPVHIDIIWVRLKEPLKPGQTIRLETPFFLKIPASLSRLGHVGESYQMTQWYPKPAVYDRQGWHTMPYLDQGEFFSEFGNFKVSITLPKNYVVAATGTLETASEISFINEKIKASENIEHTNEVMAEPFPASSTDFKTIQYTAQKVHDFAWFADKRFRINKSSVQLDNGHSVETFAYYTKSQSTMWQKATAYLNRSVKFYSDHVGNYPYESATAVQSILSKGAGMEYPMITLIGLAGSNLELDDVITHEVGHNWFYGLLGSNERDFAWMDEGLNSFYEYKYLEDYYKQDGLPFVSNFLKKKGNLRDVSMMIIDRQKQGKLLPPSTPVEWQDDKSYYLNAYEYPAIAFRMLEQYLGEEVFSDAMKSYFEVWKYRHPAPKDMQNIFEQKCNCSLNWIFVDMMRDGKSIDYKLKEGNSKSLISLENKGMVAAPIEIIGYREDQVIWREWLPGFEGEQEITLTNSLDNITHLVMYDTTYMIDVSINNNYLGGKNVNASAPLKFNFLLGSANTFSKNLYLSPMLMYNDYDKGMIGGWVHNASIPGQKLRFSVMPMYSFKAKDLAGIGELRYNAFPKNGIFKKISARLNVRKFSFDFDDHYEFIDRYSKIEPEIVFTLKPKTDRSKITSNISYRFAMINQKYGVGINFEAKEFQLVKRNYYLNELAYSLNRDYALAPSSARFSMQQGQGFLKLQSTFRQQLTYDKPSRGLFIHLFAGVLLKNDNTDANVNFLYNGTASTSIFAKDYFFDEYLIGRNTQSGILSQQVFLRDAELKTLSNVGISNKTMFGAGFSTNLPIPLPIHFYADMAIFSNPFDRKMTVSYSSGFSLVVRKNFIEVYFPVFESQDIRESLTYVERSKYLQKVSFLFNLKGFRPLENTEQFFDFLY